MQKTYEKNSISSKCELLRTETQSWRSSGSASVLLTSSSNLIDSGRLQQARHSLDPQGDAKGLVAKVAKGSPKGSHKKRGAEGTPKG